MVLTWKILQEIVALVANLGTILASSIALYIFVAKRKELSAAVKLLINFSYHTTLTELRGKLDRLNEYNVGEPSHVPEVRNILHEIAGQIRGNARLTRASPDLARKFESLADGRRLTEPNKRSLVGEAREVLRALDAGNYDDVRRGQS